jgi:anti-sigma regulatory factor (Ser/Thr protein kinase)
MSAARLHVLIALPDPGAAATVAAALRRRSHTVLPVTDTAEALAQESADVVVCDLDMLGALRRSGARTRAVVVDVPESVDAWRSTLRLGASDALSRPWRLAELVEAVEAGPRAALPARGEDALLRRSLAAEADSIEKALRELCSWLVRRSVTPAARARVLTATAEVLENTARHAYGAGLGGRVELAAALESHELCVEVRDDGTGFDPGHLPQEAREGGLSRAAALAESLRVTSQPGQGTRVVLRFSARGVDFGEDVVVDLSEHDWLSPALAQRVLASLADPEAGPFYNLSPALAVTVGRLMAGSTERQRAERALWS